MISRLENDYAEVSYDKLMILLSRFGDEFEGEKKWMHNSYCLWRIMIDINYQNKGFGKELLKAMIKWCKAFPFGESDTIYTSCDVANKKATAFYQNNGFILTDDYIDGEIVLRKGLGEEKEL